jgi:hypothetical protein
MRSRVRSIRLTETAALAIAACSTAALAQTSATISVARVGDPLTWATVANTATVIPNGDGRTFNSFNQPSVNTRGFVVLRGRSKGSDSGGGGGGETTLTTAAAAATPLHGIFSRDMARGGSLQMVFDKTTAVPPPSNVLYSGAPVAFTEFPAFPRLGISNNTILSRAQSQPTYTYVLPDLTETRVGTSGIYGLYDGARVTATSQLGAVPGFAHFSVPGAASVIKFDQFPGSPAIANASTVVFKGNYTDGTSKTGVFFRNFRDAKRPAAVSVIASSDTLVPGQPPGGVKFGSTAPPSASDNDMVFVGLDNEDAPTMGGIYRAPLASRPTLQPLVTIGQQVPGEPGGSTFTRIGEALSYDDQHIAFWAAWGADTRAVTLSCPVDGQKDVIAYCNTQYPAGFVVQVPVKQGFFLHDLKSARTYPVVKTGAQFDDFLYWTFSGRPPGVGDAEAEDFEPPRWRSAAFSATYGDSKNVLYAFKARNAGSGINGIYLSRMARDKALGMSSAISPVVEAGMRAQSIDPQAPYGALVTAIGIERDGLRDKWFAVAVSMLDPVTSESWAGVYLTQVKR